MTGFDYAELGGDAADMLQEFGAAATVRRITKVFNPATGTNVATPMTDSVFLLQMDIADAQREFGAIELSDSDQAVWSTVPAFSPQTGDTITLTDQTFGGTSVWKVGKVFPLAPGGVTVLLKIQLTR